MDFAGLVIRQCSRHLRIVGALRTVPFASCGEIENLPLDSLPLFAISVLSGLPQRNGVLA